MLLNTCHSVLQKSSYVAQFLSNQKFLSHRLSLSKDLAGKAICKQLCIEATEPSFLKHCTKYTQLGHCQATSCV